MVRGSGAQWRGSGDAERSLHRDGALNSFLDSELESILCFETDIDAEKFCKRKSAIFLTMPEEFNTRYFLISLIVQQLYSEILSVADEYGGKLKNRIMLYLEQYIYFKKNSRNGTLEAYVSISFDFKLIFWESIQHFKKPYTQSERPSVWNDRMALSYRRIVHDSYK